MPGAKQKEVEKFVFKNFIDTFAPKIGVRKTGVLRIKSK